MKILLVDDEITIVELEKQMLERLGYRATAHSNSLEALETFKADPDEYDLVITDMLMPDKEGIETILELQATYPGIKLIAMSGGGRTKNMTFLEMAKKVGAHEILSKPFKPSELLDAVERVLKGS